ncbi:hypothetical protein V8D89_006593 [Ganoderma adspersum]
MSGAGYRYKGRESLPDCIPDCLCAPPLHRTPWLWCLDLFAMATITHYDSTLGAGFIGCLFTAIMYGITCIQSFTFFQNSSKDRKVVQYAVACLLVLDTLHFIFVAATLYWYTVTHFAYPNVIQRIPWSIFGILLITPTSDGVVRCFFTYRIWILSHNNRFVTYPLIGMIITIYGFAIAFGAKFLPLSTYDQIAEISWLMYLSLGALVAADVYIAIVLCYLLYKARTGFNKVTDSLINVLLLYTVNTGLLTSVFALACFITYAAMPDNYIFLSIYLPLSKLYFNALLASLNARDYMSRRRAANEDVSIPFSSRSRTAQGTIPIEFAPLGTTQLSVLVEREEFKTISEPG